MARLKSASALEILRLSTTVKHFRLVALTALGFRLALTLAHPLQVAALGGGLPPCELPPLTLLVI